MATQTQECLSTSVLWACWLGKSQLLAHLLKVNGFDPNTSDDAGRWDYLTGLGFLLLYNEFENWLMFFRTGLHLSCLVGSQECAKLLLENGACPNSWDTSSETKATPLHCAASAKSLACVKVNRIQTWKVTQFDWLGVMLIIFLQVLIGHGADVNAGLAERSPLHYAVLSDAPEVVSELLDAGACPDTPQVRSVYVPFKLC